MMMIIDFFSFIFSSKLDGCQFNALFRLLITLQFNAINYVW